MNKPAQVAGFPIAGIVSSQLPLDFALLAGAALRLGFLLDFLAEIFLRAFARDAMVINPSG
jgi:hypothetical protein